MGLFGLGVPELAVIGAVAALAFGASQVVRATSVVDAVAASILNAQCLLMYSRVFSVRCHACRAQQTAGAWQGPWPDREELPRRSQGAPHPFTSLTSISVGA